MKPQFFIRFRRLVLKLPMQTVSKSSSLLRPWPVRVFSLRLSLPVLVTALMISVTAAADEPELPEVVQFNQHIRPILNRHCSECHGGVKQAGDVSFVYREQVVAPDGWIVEPGEPDESLLLERVQETDPDLRMPPPEHGAALNAGEIALLRRWIEQGAKWQVHWAYQSPQSTPPPKVDSGWPAVPMDRFVYRRLVSERILPAPDAQPDRWLRRVSLDLTGLPPTVEQRKQFLDQFQASPEQARNAVVQRLLDSPAFGERWASVWLDQVRYADSKGLGIDGRRNIWKYRDWVIQSFNDDLPYDQFTIKQIAGDLLPDPTIEDLVATAAHRLTQTNEEGGTDDEEFRVAAVLDRVNTTWQAWQGVTFGCVQCHSHPYDPFRHEDYYRFAAFFNNTVDCDLNEDLPTVDVPIQRSEYEQASQLDREIRKLKQEIWEHEFATVANPEAWTSLAELDARTNNSTKIVTEIRDGIEEFRTLDTVHRGTDITVESPLPQDLERLTGVRLTLAPEHPESARSDSEWGFSIAHIEVAVIAGDSNEPVAVPLKRIVVDEPEPIRDPQASLDPKSNHGLSAYTRIHYPRQAVLLVEGPVELTPGSRIRITLKHRSFILSAFSLVTRRGSFAVTSSVDLMELDQDPKLQAKRKQLKERLAERKKIRSTPIPVLRERPKSLQRPTHVFVRGLFLTKDKQVSPGVPNSLAPLADDAPADRLALANWMVSPENPLTSRVEVNRIWARLFGMGLVATEEDFGSSGEPPSHPELLDHLAYRFQHEWGWSRKRLIREIVLSRTYRQSSVVRPELQERDPQNRLLAQGPRHRLSAEMVRDQALAISGLLSEKMFGPPVHPPIPDGVWRPFAAGDKWNTPATESEDRYRRSIYTYTKRSIPYPMFAAFDAPSREICSPRRLRSNTPLQALTTLNDRTFADCAGALAAQMQAVFTERREQLRYGFVRATCREPTPAELQDLIELAGTGEVRSDTDVDSGLIAAATVLLNLDEVLTR